MTRNELGMIYASIGQLDTVLPHFQQAIRLYEDAGKHDAAAQTRFNVAIALLQANRQAGRPELRPRRPAGL